MSFSILHRYTGAVLYGSATAGRIAAAVTEAARSRADLSSANLYGANLSGADLSRAKINWQSHDLLAEILRLAAGADIQKRSVAGLILVSRDWCWKEFLALDHPEKEWALTELAKWIQDGDRHPEILDEYRQGALR